MDSQYPDAKKVALAMDNPNAHVISSLYKAFPPEDASRMARRLEIHCTPKLGGWLGIAEIELSTLAAQCLESRRIQHLSP